MIGWMGAHPWMTFFLAMGVIDAVHAILAPPPCPPAAGTTPTTTPGSPQTTMGKLIPFVTIPNIAIPAGNGVYHGLVRR